LNAKPGKTFDNKLNKNKKEVKMNKLLEKGAVVLTVLGAVNWGISTWLPQYDLLGFVPAGIIHTGAVALITASGGYVAYLLYQKKI
jgi:uncharacterized membrane protein YuzA (DUF378 family)